MPEVWPDSELQAPAILSPRHVLERLSWRIARLESYLRTADLEMEAFLSIETRLDALYAEYRQWFLESETATRQRQIEVRQVQLIDEVEGLWNLVAHLL